jgi:hypothetical protein
MCVWFVVHDLKPQVRLKHGGTLARERLYVLLPFDVAQTASKLPATGNAFVALAKNPSNTQHTRPKVSDLSAASTRHRVLA